MLRRRIVPFLLIDKSHDCIKTINFSDRACENCFQSETDIIWQSESSVKKSKRSSVKKSKRSSKRRSSRK